MLKPKRMRCPECGTRRTDPRAMVLHRLKCPRPICHCLTGATYPHRPGSTLTCEGNPMSGMHLAVLHGATPEEAADIALEIALAGGGKPSTVCPF
jgi:hypothetical protein